jgi:cation diffusion facilitator family transporter
MSSAVHPTSKISTGNLQSGARVALFGMVINFVLAAAKIITGFVGNSYVLIADGIESALDIAGSVVIWGGLKVAARPPDATHPYGHGKAEPIAAIAVSIGVLAAAFGLASQSVHEIFLPHHAPSPFTLVVLVTVIVVKELMYRYVIRVGRDVESTAVQTDAWHHRTDALTSLAALVGISIALIGGRGWESADSWAALFACVLIGANGFRLLRPALHEIMDTAPGAAFVHRVEAVAEAVPGVRAIEKCYIRKMGLSFYVDLHAKVDGGMTVRQGHDIAHQVKRAIQEENARVADVLVHIEPDRRGES